MKNVKLNESQKNTMLFAGLGILALWLAGRSDKSNGSPISKPWLGAHAHRLGGPVG
jgi:hypothetical protein